MQGVITLNASERAAGRNLANRCITAAIRGLPSPPCHGGSCGCHVKAFGRTRISASLRSAGIGVLFLTMTVVAACTGSGGPPAATPTPSPPSSATVTISSINVTVPTIATSGISLVGTLPVATTPPGVPPPSVTETISVSDPAGSTPLLPSPIVYVELSSSTSFTFPWSPAFAFTAASISSGESYYLGYYNGTEWAAPFEGPGTVSGNAVSFAMVLGTSPEFFPITPTQPEIFALYASP